MQLRITDNGKRKLSDFPVQTDSDEYSQVVSDLKKIADKPLGKLDISNLLIFPQDWRTNKDDIQKSSIISLENLPDDQEIISGSIMGFAGYNDTRLTITSRFAKDYKKDYFLHYMLQRVCKLNILNLNQSPSNEEDMYDFLIYFFPDYLQRALAQGLYKEYRRNDYNDANIKGALDVKRHIRINMPFMGKIAYTTREHSYDNNVLQLIRHTIEHIKNHPYASEVLSKDADTIGNVTQIMLATPSYNKNDRRSIVNKNTHKPVVHPYFTEYKELQKLCLRILRHEKLVYGEEKNKIYGILFDGSWLWEEYLNTFLQEKFDHPENKTGKKGESLLKDERGNTFQNIYPDFIEKANKKNRIIADAKYIQLDNQKNYDYNDERATSIYYKTITYLCRFNSNNGWLLFPRAGSDFEERYTVIDTDVTITKRALKIPVFEENFGEFCRQMKTEENSLLKKWDMYHN